MAFNFNPQVDINKGDRVSACLGAAANEGWTAKEIGKLVALEAASTDSNYKLAAVDTDIEGFVVSVEAHTENGGFSFGTVQRDGRVKVVNASAGALAVGDFVINAAQTAVGTAGLGRVKAGAGTAFKWRVIDLQGGSGAVSSTVLIERI